MIKPSDIAIYVFGTPQGPLCDWLQLQSQMGYQWKRWGAQWGAIDSARNSAILHFLKNGHEYAMLLDPDVYPWIVAPVAMSGIEKLLTEEGDCLYAGWASPGGKGHYGHGDFSASCCRLSASLLRDMGPPWFSIATDLNGVAAACDCQSFRKALHLKGYKSRMVCVAGHNRQAIAFPHGELDKYMLIDPEVI